MSIDVVSPLRQRMIEDMSQHAKLSAHTQRLHISSCKRSVRVSPTAHPRLPPSARTVHQLPAAPRRDPGQTYKTRNRLMTGLRFLLSRVTLRRLDLAAEILLTCANHGKIPQVISRDEARRLLAVANSLRTRLLLSPVPTAMELRASEVIRLKVKHIDSAQRIIRVEQGKGRKDRNVMLSPELLDLLRQWWRERPSRHDAATPLQERWLFPGKKPGKPMTTRQLIALFHEAVTTPPGCRKTSRCMCCVQSRLCNASARTRHRYPRRSGALGSRQTQRCRPLFYHHHHRHNRQHREPARPADATEREAEEQEGSAAGVIPTAMSRPALEVADIFRDHGAAWRLPMRATSASTN